MQLVGGLPDQVREVRDFRNDAAGLGYRSGVPGSLGGREKEDYHQAIRTCQQLVHLQERYYMRLLTQTAGARM